MHSFSISFNQRVRFIIITPFFKYKPYRLLVILFALLPGIGSAKASPLVLQQPVIHVNRLTDSVSDRIKDSLKLELQQAKLNDPVTERHYLMSLLKEEQATISVQPKRRGQKFYYKLAVAFTKLRLYPLAMKCYFKTLTIENRTDTLYTPLVTASIEGKQLMADDL